MCARYTLTTTDSLLSLLKEAETAAAIQTLNSAATRSVPAILQPRYNVAPSQPILIIRTSAATGKRELAAVRWGLIPSWAKSPDDVPLLLNARSETAASKPSFRGAIRRRRCLIPADGFFEWKTVGKRKQPYFIHLKGKEPFAFAGIWEAWESPEGYLESAAIMTTEPNELIAEYHHRMPVILKPEEYDFWLDPAMIDPKPLERLLQPFPAEAMAVYPVTPKVNRSIGDDPKYVLPLEE